MSPTTPGMMEGRQPGGEQAKVGLEYVPTEEERRLFQECNHESFWYRSVPFSVVSMAVTQTLVANGALSASLRFGSLPKVAFAGLFGYIAGKLSYMKTCQEKFKRLENSPLGEALRQRGGLPLQRSSGAQSELSDPNDQSFKPMFQPADNDSQKSYFTESPVEMGKSDDFSAPAEPYVEEEPKRKGILYEDLRLKNRENYEVMLSQKADPVQKASPEKETRNPIKTVKNIYGDTWEE